MLRYRRYRVFVAFAVITLYALWKFGSSSTSWENTVDTAKGQLKGEKDAASLTWNPHPQVAQETKKPDLEVPPAQTSQILQTPPPIAPVSRPADKPAAHAPTKPAAKPSPVDAVENEKTSPTPAGELIEAPGEGRVDLMPLSTTIDPIHWQKQIEHFPVPSKSIIKLPSGKPKPIPKIQYAFKPESEAAKRDRESKLGVIKGAMQRSWDGYKKNAWLHDELSPVSGKNRDPFAGWGATLVDALDTLWIMGMKEEFEEAVKAVDKIDFTTTTRADIPLFETTIRYLGGFLAAYDLSDRKYKNLLAKAVELAEILISAFDTPNRMPQTYYYWRPAFASQPHRASNRIVLAEIGSLSVEFTRLAQLTGEHKYYDAIARITDALEEFQNKTRLPGMWPTYLDASGCKRIEYQSEVDVPLQSPLGEPFKKDEPLKAPEPSATKELSPLGNEYIPLDLPSPIVFSAVAGPVQSSPAPLAAGEVGKTKIKNWDEKAPVAAVPLKPSPAAVPGEAGKMKINGWDDNTPVSDLTKDSALKKRQLDDDGSSNATPATPAAASSAASASPTSAHPECEEQGFVSSSDQGNEEYTLGGMSDSTYEYLPKEWLLLGGQVEKYRTMYEMSMDVVKENLLFRPMIPKNDDILFSGKLNVAPTKPEVGNGDLEAENAHLTCFAGGMFGMGAKIFDRPEDLEIAKKLTEGCVHSYDMTATGIMPEAFDAVICESMKHCEWNETKYYEILDPHAETRLTLYESQMQTYKQQMESASAWYAEEMASFTAPPLPLATPVGAGALANAVAPTPVARVEADLESTLERRQLDDAPSAVPKPHVPTVPEPHIPQRQAPERNLMVEGEMEEAEGPPTPVQIYPSVEPSKTIPTFPVIYSPKPPLSHDEYVKNKIQEERLPPGVVYVKARNYILRPEAIESVWYMYRITGDPHWREAGWRMFEAVNTHTSTVYGNSAIDDVTKTVPELNDEMESFWLAETLKYFYLLFADEGVVSLDEWVLNTEAHPFKRPG